MNLPDWITIYNEDKTSRSIRNAASKSFPEFLSTVKGPESLIFHQKINYCNICRVVTTGKGIYGHDDGMEFERDGYVEEVESLKSDIIKKVLSVTNNNKGIPYTLIYLIKHTLNTCSESLIAHLIATTFDDDEGRNIPEYLQETPEIIDLAKDANKSYDTFIELKRGALTHSFLKCEAWSIYLYIKGKKS
ncbi:hypothetical protein F8M41_006822 [Gigaspora margarita]|uniref:Uncharacterized protein n=1 Tax=Gigaspora margarita TaxID=4874 RepID=A0A8H3X5X0_GIGMA|nr:hypothetical protein F8M41_006822 [Gigaspora margarita]